MKLFFDKKNISYDNSLFSPLNGLKFIFNKLIFEFSVPFGIKWFISLGISSILVGYYEIPSHIITNVFGINNVTSKKFSDNMFFLFWLFQVIELFWHKENPSIWFWNIFFDWNKIKNTISWFFTKVIIEKILFIFFDNVTNIINNFKNMLENENKKSNYINFLNKLKISLKMSDGSDIRLYEHCKFIIENILCKKNSIDDWCKLSWLKHNGSNDDFEGLQEEWLYVIHYLIPDEFSLYGINENNIFNNQKINWKDIPNSIIFEKLSNMRNDRNSDEDLLFKKIQNYYKEVQQKLLKLHEQPILQF